MRLDSDQTMRPEDDKLLWEIGNGGPLERMKKLASEKIYLFKQRMSVPHASVINRTMFGEFLKQCRQGDLRGYFYYMLHGFPTALPVKVGDQVYKLQQNADEINKCLCCDDMNYTTANGELYWNPWVESFLNEGKNAEELLDMECAKCKSTRPSTRSVVKLPADTLR